MAYTPKTQDKEKPHLRAPEPSTMVIFGATGDLTRRKLIPALYRLYSKGRLPEDFAVVGVARTKMGDDGFRSEMHQAIKKFDPRSLKNAKWETFAKKLFYIEGDVTRTADYDQVDRRLRTLSQEYKTSNRVYYLAVAPRFYENIVTQLGEHKMAGERDGWRRVVIEKPFGHNLNSAQALNQVIHQWFEENQVYRIDHYLGKETAQNIMFFRFANTIFEPVWNRHYVDNIQITVGESVDVGHRAGYYDQAGVVRDMFQNHLLQLLSLVTMEPPASFNADALRNEKVEVLAAVRPVALNETVRAQYENYRQTDGVAPDSQTATFTALKLFIDNWRWQGVPFYLRSGKELAKKTTEITIEFECPPHLMFDFPKDHQITPNIFSICIQPDEGIHLKFETKLPDSVQETRSVDMEFHYQSSFGDITLPDAYERLLLDVLQGDAALFTRSDEIEVAWQLIDPILDGWRASDTPPLATYQPGSWGPAEADELITRDERVWRTICGEHGAENS